MLLRHIAGTAIAAALLVLPAAASAGQNSSIGMSEAVVANCSAIPTSFSVQLNDFDPISGNWPGWSTNQAQFQCTKGATPVFTFDNGANGTSSGYLRNMSDGNGHGLTYLSYLCFQPALYHTYNEVIGGACIDTVPSQAASAQNYVTAYPTGNGASELIYLTLYNVVYPNNQDAAVGHYTDSYTATLNY